MITFKLHTKKKDSLVLGIGLNDDDIAELARGHTIGRTLDDMGFENTQIVVTQGPTDSKIAFDLRRIKIDND